MKRPACDRDHGNDASSRQPVRLVDQRELPGSGFQGADDSDEGAWSQWRLLPGLAEANARHSAGRQTGGKLGQGRSHSWVGCRSEEEQQAVAKVRHPLRQEDGPARQRNPARASELAQAKPPAVGCTDDVRLEYPVERHGGIRTPMNAMQHRSNETVCGIVVEVECEAAVGSENASYLWEMKMPDGFCRGIVTGHRDVEGAVAERERLGCGANHEEAPPGRDAAHTLGWLDSDDETTREPAQKAPRARANLEDATACEADERLVDGTEVVGVRIVLIEMLGDSIVVFDPLAIQDDRHVELAGLEMHVIAEVGSSGQEPQAEPRVLTAEPENEASTHCSVD